MSRIRSNTVALGTSFFVTALFYFLQLKLITVHVDQEAVGVWAALVAMGALLGTFTEMGFPQVIVRYAAKFDAEGRLERIGALIGFSLRVHYVALFVMGVLLSLGGAALWRLVSPDPIDRPLLLLGYLAPASGTLRAINNASFRGLRRMGWVAGLEIGFSAIVTLGYYLLRERLTVGLILGVFLAASLTVGFLGLAVSLRLLGRAAPAARHDSRPILGEIIDYWQGAAAAGIFLIAVEWLDKLLLAGLATFQTVAIFQVVSRLALFPRRLLAVPMQVLNPEITHKWEGGRGHELAGDMALFIKLMLGLGLVLIAPITLFARPLILLVSTPEFLPGAPALWLFTAAIPILCLYQPLVLFLRAVGHVWLAFIADASWLTLYLGSGSLLVGAFGLPGFVAGQVVASFAVLAYTLAVFHRRRLPNPGPAFFVRRVVISMLVWGVCLAGGVVMPAGIPLWLLFLMGILVLLVANVLMVRGGFLTREEEARAVTLLAGRGRPGRLAGFLFAWPRRLGGGAATVLAALLLGAGAPLLAGCGGLPEGCVADDAVPGSVRRELETASREFFDRVRFEDAQAIFSGAASKVRTESSLEEFVTPIALAVRRLGFPERLALDRLWFVNYGPGTPVEFPVKCAAEEGDVPDELLLIRHPRQAGLVHTGQAGGETVRFSTLWFHEDGGWRIAAFFAKRATALGHDADYYARLAEQERAAGHLRNTALLYNLVLDLHVPNAWTRPAGVKAIQDRQRSVSTTQLPADRLDLWPAGADTFRVYQVGYRLWQGNLDLVMSRETDHVWADSLLIYRESGRLFEYARDRFPEYPGVFAGVAIRATPPGRSDLPGLIRYFPFRDTP